MGANQSVKNVVESEVRALASTLVEKSLVVSPNITQSNILDVGVLRGTVRNFSQRNEATVDVSATQTALADLSQSVDVASTAQSLAEQVTQSLSLNLSNQEMSQTVSNCVDVVNKVVSSAKVVCAPNLTQTNSMNYGLIDNTGVLENVSQVNTSESLVNCIMNSEDVVSSATQLATDIAVSSSQKQEALFDFSFLLMIIPLVLGMVYLVFKKGVSALYNPWFQALGAAAVFGVFLTAMSADCKGGDDVDDDADEKTCSTGMSFTLSVFIGAVVFVGVLFGIWWYHRGKSSGGVGENITE